VNPKSLSPKIDTDLILSAHERIKPFTNRTPVLTSALIDEITGASLFFKAEHLQKAGAFKTRGAVNVVFSLSEVEAEKGVATHSSGNHGAALARAAGLRKIPAFIVVPENAKQAKLDAIASYGGNIIKCEATLDARERSLREVVGKTGAHFVPPYDDIGIIAGQGTTAIEFIEDVPELEIMVIPVGGGGLLSGCSIVAKSAGNIEVYGAEPSQADDAYRSLKSGIRVERHNPNTIADGLLTTLGEINFEIIRDNVDDIILVSEEEIVHAMRLIWSRMKQIVEPSSAVTLAAILSQPHRFQRKKVGLILTGGNVDLTDLPF